MIAEIVDLFPDKKKIDIEDMEGIKDIFLRKSNIITCAHCQSDDMGFVDKLYKIAPNKKNKKKYNMPVLAIICCNCGYISLFSTAVLTNYVDIKG